MSRNRGKVPKSEPWIVLVVVVLAVLACAIPYLIWEG